MKRKIFTVLGVVLISLTLTGCGEAPKLKNGEEVVASLKGEKISANDLYDALKKQGGQSVLTNLIDTYILDKEVKTDEDAKTYADSQFESYKSSYESNGQDFSAILKQAGYNSEDDFKKILITEYKRNKVTENYVKDKITDSEIEDYYENKVFGNIEAKHILIKPDVSSNASSEEKTKAEEKAKKEAEDIIKKLDKGENFDKLAKKYSDDTGTAKNGGKLTVVYGEVVDEFWNATNKLKDGEYTKEPVKSQYGYHVIYRIKQDKKKSLKDMRSDIIDKIVDQKTSDDSTLSTQAMVALRKKYKLKINDNELDKEYNDAVKEALAANSSTSSSK